MSDTEDILEQKKTEFAEIFAGLKKGPLPFKKYMEFCLHIRESSFLQEINYSSRFLDSFAKAFVIAAQEMLKFCEGTSIYDFGVSHPSFVKRVAKLMPSIDYWLVEHKYSSWGHFSDEMPKNVQFTHDSEVSEVTGIIISNKLFSMLPIHIIVKDPGPREVYVTLKAGEFTEVLVKLDMLDMLDKIEDISELKEYLKRVEDPRTRVEVCLEAVRFLKSMGERLSKGFVITSDYLLDPSEMTDTERSSGTLTCYNDTTRTYNPYLMPGKLIIRASVNLSALVEYGGDVGLKVTGLTNHMHLMKSTSGIVDEFSKELEKISGSKYRDSKLGTVRILIQQKCVKNPILKSLKFVPQFGFWERYNYPIGEDLEILPEG